MQNTANFPFIERTFEDTMKLLQEAQHFATCQHASANNNYDHFEQFYITAEVTRLVSYLTNVMTWILWQKADRSGQVTPTNAESMAKMQLDSKIFAASSSPYDVDLPDILDSLIGRTDLLQARVRRLSQMVH